MMIRTKYIAAMTIAAAVAGIALVGTAFAQTNGYGNYAHMGAPGSRPMMRPGVVGTVASVSGTTLTVTSHGFGRNASTTPATTYTVDASNATVFKDNATSSISSVATGDMVFVQGTVSGDSVTATSIRDGIPMMGTRGPGGMGGRGSGMGGYASSTLPQGNGQPVIGGTVSAISGTTLTITNSGGTAYTIDASGATVQRGGTANATVSNIAVGDHVIAQGSISGSSVTATTIIDQPAVAASASVAAPSHGGGFFGSIGNFFKRLFGF